MKVGLKEFYLEVTGKPSESYSTDVATKSMERWKIPMGTSGDGSGKKVWRNVDVSQLKAAKAAFKLEKAALKSVGRERLSPSRSNGSSLDKSLHHKIDVISSQLETLSKWLHSREARILTAKEEKEKVE